MNNGNLQIKSIADQGLPESIEAEMAVLGSMLLSTSALHDCAEIIEDHRRFYKPQHGYIFKAMQEMSEAAVGKIDPLTTMQHLRDTGNLDKAGGTDYLMEICESIPSAVGAASYAKIVVDKARLRDVISICDQGIHKVYQNPKNADDHLEEIEGNLFALGDSTQKDREAVTIGALMQKQYEILESEDGHETGLPTGLADLTDLLQGLHKSQMIIIAGRPSMGKTALGMNIASYLACDVGVGVGIFSMEMSRDQIAHRMLCGRSGVDSNKVRRNRLNKQEFDALKEQVSLLAPAPMHIDDAPALTVQSLRARARRMVGRDGVQMLVIDYMQLMEGKGENRQQQISGISRGIKSIARELDVPIICLSQLNRSAESREGHRPMMSDLRESGAIEQDADVVMLLHREEYYHRHDPEWPTKQGNEGKVGLAEVIVAKQRSGPVGTVKLKFNAATTSFRNYIGV